MTGIVSTKILPKHPPQANIPLFSPFKRASTGISAIASISLIEGGMTLSEYARRVAVDVLGDVSGSIWRGNMASLAWAMSSLFPTWLLVSYVLSSGLALWNIRRRAYVNNVGYIGLELNPRVRVGILGLTGMMDMLNGFVFCECGVAYVSGQGRNVD